MAQLTAHDQPDPHLHHHHRRRAADASRAWTITASSSTTALGSAITACSSRSTRARRVCAHTVRWVKEVGAARSSASKEPRRRPHWVDRAASCPADLTSKDRDPASLCRRRPPGQAHPRRRHDGVRRLGAGQAAPRADGLRLRLVARMPVLHVCTLPAPGMPCDMDAVPGLDTGSQASNQVAQSASSNIPCPSQSATSASISSL